MQQPLDHLPDEPNPYDFVPFEDAPTYVESAPSLGRATGRTGRINFTLKALTPVCIRQGSSDDEPVPAGHVHEFLRVGDSLIISGTSLKGMLRSVHEVVTNSRMGVVKTKERRDRDVAYLSQLPAAYLPGGGKALTTSEALFGVVGGDAEASLNRAGRVVIDDIPTAFPLVARSIPRPPRSFPKPTHEAFYFDVSGNNEALGRKFYFHQYPGGLVEFYADREIPSERVETIAGEFAGVLRFTNLTDEELGSLLYTIMLEERLAHKLGYGRPFGYGSVRFFNVSVEEELRENGVPARFRQYALPERQGDNWSGATLSDQDIRALSSQARQAWLDRSQDGESYRAFVEIMRWPPSRRYVYPDRGFFAEERRRLRTDQQATPLWVVQDRATIYPGGTRKPSPPKPPPQPPPQPVLPPEPAIDLSEVGQLRTRSGYEPAVRAADGKFYQLHDTSGPPEVVERLRELLAQHREPKIRFNGQRIKVGGKFTPVAMNVDIVAEG